MKFIVFAVFLLSNIIYMRAQTDEQLCKYISNEFKEKGLECTDNSKIKKNDEIYQFIKWSAFNKRKTLIRIEREGKKMAVVKKELTEHHYDQKNGAEIQQKLEVVIDKKITEREYKKFKSLLSEFNFWQKGNYDINSPCMDGGGIITFAVERNRFIKQQNGNCAPKDEYLNELYKKISELFNF